MSIVCISTNYQNYHAVGKGTGLGVRHIKVRATKDFTPLEVVRRRWLVAEKVSDILDPDAKDRTWL